MNAEAGKPAYIAKACYFETGQVVMPLNLEPAWLLHGFPPELGPVWRVDRMLQMRAQMFGIFAVTSFTHYVPDCCLRKLAEGGDHEQVFSDKHNELDGPVKEPAKIVHKDTHPVVLYKSQGRTWNDR